MIDATDQKIYSDQTKKQTITQATASSKRASEYLELLNKTKAQKQVVEHEKKELINQLVEKEVFIEDLESKLLQQQSPITVIGRNNKTQPWQHEIWQLIIE